jgi:ribosomal protein S18 acetylase RimI-like enzyme
VLTPDSIDAYCDAAPRLTARAERIASLVLFVNPRGWPYYARPARGVPSPTVNDVRDVRRRQRALEVPESFEWIDDVSPGLAGVCEAAGLEVRRHPLMALDVGGAGGSVPSSAALRLLTPEDDFAAFVRVGARAFGVDDETPSPAMLAYVAERVRDGATVSAGAFVDGELVAIGSHQPVGDVTELAGVGTLPAFRGRGLATAISAFLVADTASRGIPSMFLSASDERVSRLYARVGFRVVGTACTASPRETASPSAAADADR